MAKVKYYYDTKTLSYKRIELSKVKKIRNLLYFLIGSAFTGVIMIIIFFQFFDSPKEKILNREIKQLTTQYEVIQKKLDQVEIVLDDMEQIHEEAFVPEITDSSINYQITERDGYEWKNEDGKFHYRDKDGDGVWHPWGE